ncbi:hypothetical protein FHW89_001407 [Mucilaginibacter sp. SG564]|nr:hypothetical protein [Mucilaginibacter sp. SG564]
MGSCKNLKDSKKGRGCVFTMCYTVREYKIFPKLVSDIKDCEEELSPHF